MEVKDMIGMMSTGALLALGVVFISDKIGGGDAAPQTGFTATQQSTAPAQNTVLQQPEQSDSATRADVSLLGQTTAAQIDRIVALSQGTLSQVEALTPEQEEIIAFFERTAREMNQQDHSAPTGDVRFSNMAVQGLNVRYFYRLPADFASVNTSALLADQGIAMRQTLCGNEAIVTLLNEYGFSYTYTYVSADSRQIGRIMADGSACA